MGLFPKGFLQSGNHIFNERSGFGHPNPDREQSLGGEPSGRKQGRGAALRGGELYVCVTISIWVCVLNWTFQTGSFFVCHERTPCQVELVCCSVSKLACFLTGNLSKLGIPPKLLMFVSFRASAKWEQTSTIPDAEVTHIPLDTVPRGQLDPDQKSR